MSLVQYVLRRPYTVVAALLLVALLGIGEVLRMPVDIFPKMDIPVCSVVWNYAGMSATDIQNRILTLYERQMASLVDDIARIEGTSYQGVGVEKVYLHEGADVTRAIAQLAGAVPLWWQAARHHGRPRQRRPAGARAHRRRGEQRPADAERDPARRG